MSGDELTNNEPTVRHWRDISGRIDPVPPGYPQATFEEVIALRLRTEVVVLTPAELAAHTTAACADAWAEGYVSGAREHCDADDCDASGYNPYVESGALTDD